MGFYDAHERWQEIVEQMHGIKDLQPKYDDEDFYLDKPLTTGMTVRFGKDDKKTYGVLQVMRNGKVLIIDSNNDTMIVDSDDLLVAEESLNPANKNYDGVEEVINISTPKKVEVIIWKKAWIDSTFVENDIVMLPNGLQGVVIGKARGKVQTASSDALGNVVFGWNKSADLVYASEDLSVSDNELEQGVDNSMFIEPNFGFYDNVRKEEEKNRRLINE